ncbi:MAG TPA: metallophosphoesterase family protein [Thermoanaerobaculia bacterium]|nr:metallophosphoesterase family protein [Thermoanaerobaculia bacterium]
MRQILHISDIHFGPPHLAELAAEIHRFADDHHPDVVVVSGDLTQRAKPRQFRAARAFIDRLPAPALVVPGNHDVPMYRFWERIFDPFGAYRRHFSPDLEPIFQDDELFLVGINTAHGWTVKEGRIRLSRLRQVADLLQQVPDGLVKMVVAHHHMIPPPRFGTQSVLSNAYQAIELFSDAGVELVLSGHQHQTYLATSEEFYPSGREPVLMLHAGTTTSSRGRGSESNRNTFNWIRVDDRSLRFSLYRWEPTVHGFVEASRHFYPRRTCSPYCLVELD